MSNKKVRGKQHALKDAIVWRNVTQYLVSKGYFRLVDQIAFLGVSSEYFYSSNYEAHGFDPKTIARFIDRTGMNEEELYSERGVSNIELKRKTDNILTQHPSYHAAMILLEAGDVEGADNIMTGYLKKKYPS